jgi:hypothetical protein
MVGHSTLLVMLGHFTQRLLWGGWQSGNMIWMRHKALICSWLGAGFRNPEPFGHAFLGRATWAFVLEGGRLGFNARVLEDAVCGACA